MLDKRLLVQLRDGRKVLGVLRSFDQFANLVLEGATERLIAGSLYCELPLGLFIIRGENVVLLGEIDPARCPCAQPAPGCACSARLTPLPLLVQGPARGAAAGARGRRAAGPPR